jgi:hypothetical protein
MPLQCLCSLAFYKEKECNDLLPVDTLTKN